MKLFDNLDSACEECRKLNKGIKKGSRNIVVKLGRKQFAIHFVKLEDFRAI